MAKFSRREMHGGRRAVRRCCWPAYVADACLQRFARVTRQMAHQQAFTKHLEAIAVHREHRRFAGWASRRLEGRQLDLEEVVFGEGHFRAHRGLKLCAACNPLCAANRRVLRQHSVCSGVRPLPRSHTGKPPSPDAPPPSLVPPGVGSR